MDINNNQQINTFTKGMNTDVSDMLMDSSQYRYAENVRLVTNTESNSGEIRLTDGTEHTNWPLFPGGIIKAMTSIRDVMVVAGFSRGVDNIYVYDTSDNKGWVYVYEGNKDELFGEFLSLVTRYENDNLIKLYIADGENQLMYINLAPYIKYEGSAPDPIKGIDSIVMNIEEFIKPILTEVSDAAGNVPGVKVLYAYRYYKLGGAASLISPLSKVVTIYKTSNEGFKETDTTTSKSVNLTLPKAPEGEINMMQIYRISYIQVGQLPLVNMIYDEKIMSEQQYVDNGQSVLSVDASEFLSTIKFTFIPKVIESKNNYLFAGNIKYIQSDIDSKVDNDDIRCVSSGDYENGILLTYNKLLRLDNIMLFDPQDWMLCDNTGQPKTPNKFGGEGTYLSWTYNIRKIAIDRDNNKYIKDSQDKYLKTEELLCSLRLGEVYRYGAVLYDNKGNKSSVKWIADIMSPVLKDVDTKWLSVGNWSNEQGLFPSGCIQKQKSFPALEADYFYYTYQIGIDFKVKSLPEGVSGIEIVRVNRAISDKITITEGIGGFPYRIYHKDIHDTDIYSKTQYICPTGYMTTTMMYADSSEAEGEEGDQFMNSNKAISDNSYLMFSSPEYVYQSDDVLNIIKTYKNNITLDVKYNIHCNNGTINRIDGDTWGISDWIINNGGVPQYPYYLTSFGAGRKTGSSSEELHEADLDLNYGAYFFDSSNFIPKFVRDNVDAESLGDIRSVWCFMKYCAYKSTDGCKQGLEHYVYTQLKDEDVTGTRRWTISACVGLAHEINLEQVDNSSFYIDEIAYPQVPSYDNFFGTDENLTNWTNDVTPIGSETTYSNWSAPLLLGMQDPIGHMRNESEDVPTIPDYYRGFDTDTPYEGMSRRFPVLYPTGSTGKCAVIHLNKPMKISSYGWTTSGLTVSIQSLPVIRMRKSGTTPYNGESTISTSTYSSHGNMVNSSTTISVFDGDCFPGVFIYHASHAWYEPNTPAGVRLATVYILPIESDIDLSATWGDTYNKLQNKKPYYVQDVPCAIVNGFLQDKDAYRYNTAYGTFPSAITYSAIKYTEIDTSACDTRVHHSQPKVNGEHIDNWLNFKALDFLDVDSRYGEITNMRLFKDTMLYWLNNATGVLSINERTVLNDVSDNLIILGTGDVLLRYDHISTTYGMLPNQYEAETQSNSTQYYWDGQNKELLAYAGGMELLPLTKSKAVMSYINNNDAVEHPSLSYDNKFNELISSVVDSGSIVYNEQTLNFTSVYTFNPTYRATINNRLYYNDDNSIYRTSITKRSNSTLFGQPANPLLLYVINKDAQYNKVFDITTFGGRFYGGDNLNNLTFDFYTPLKQHSIATGNDITNREYDFRLAIPRNEGSSYGDRMRGKTMQCELSSSSNSTDFSLQYIITKYRMSWS